MAAVLVPVSGVLAGAPLPDTKQMVLRLADMPTGFAPESGHYVSNAQQTASTTPHRNFEKLGRITGYSARYTKDGIVGLLQIESEANVYRSATLAHRSFLGGVKAVEAQKTISFRRLAVGDPLGHEARLYKATTTESGTKVDVYALAWRSGGVIASVTGAGLAGTVDPADLVLLARKQQPRISRVAK